MVSLEHCPRDVINHIFEIGDLTLPHYRLVNKAFRDALSPEPHERDNIYERCDMRYSIKYLNKVTNGVVAAGNIKLIQHYYDEKWPYLIRLQDKIIDILLNSVALGYTTDFMGDLLWANTVYNLGYPTDSETGNIKMGSHIKYDPKIYIVATDLVLGLIADYHMWPNNMTTILYKYLNRSLRKSVHKKENTFHDNELNVIGKDIIKNYGHLIDGEYINYFKKRSPKFIEFCTGHAIMEDNYLVYLLLIKGISCSGFIKDIIALILAYCTSNTQIRYLTSLINEFSNGHRKVYLTTILFNLFTTGASGKCNQDVYDILVSFGVTESVILLDDTVASNTTTSPLSLIIDTVMNGDIGAFTALYNRDTTPIETIHSILVTCIGCDQLNIFKIVYNDVVGRQLVTDQLIYKLAECAVYDASTKTSLYYIEHCMNVVSRPTIIYNAVFSLYELAEHGYNMYRLVELYNSYEVYLLYLKYAVSADDNYRLLIKALELKIIGKTLLLTYILKNVPQLKQQAYNAVDAEDSMARLICDYLYHQL